MADEAPDIVSDLLPQTYWYVKVTRVSEKP